MAIIDELIGRIGFQVTGTDQVKQALSVWERARRSLLIFANRFRGRGRFIADIFRGMRDEFREMRRGRNSVGEVTEKINAAGFALSAARGAAGLLRGAIVGVGVAAATTVGIIGGLAFGIKAATAAAGKLGKELLNVRGESIAAEARGTNKSRTENLTAGLSGALGIERGLAEKLAQTMQRDMDKIMRGVQAGEEKDIESAKKLGLLEYMKRGDADSSVAALKALGMLQDKKQAYADKPGLPSRLRDVRQYESELGNSDAYRFIFAAMEKRLKEASDKGERYTRDDFLNEFAASVEKNRTQSQGDRNAVDARNKEAAASLQQSSDIVSRSIGEMATRAGGMIARSIDDWMASGARHFQENASKVNEFLDNPEQGVTNILQDIRNILTGQSTLWKTLENAKPTIKPENFGNDQRQVSITIHQQVTGETAPAAAAGAVQSSLGKSTNTPTIDFGVP